MGNKKEKIAEKAIKLSEGKKARKIKNRLNRFSANGLRNDVARALAKGGLKSPAELLAAVVAGYDVRGGERGLIDIVREVQSRGLDELPTLDEWTEIVLAITTNERYRHELVPLEMSVKSAESLSRYLYASKEQTENVNVELASEKKLSKKEIKKFLKAFNAEF